jgi:aconitate hydratase
VLESVLRNCDGKRVSEAAVRALANWKPVEERTEEIPFVVARIVLQDFTGVPLLVDLAAMRSAVAKLGKNPKIIEPLVPVDLVVDHSVQVDFAGGSDSLERNLDLEFTRNRERYQFLKWGMQAFDTFKVVPPGIGIVHQVNLEYLAKGVLSQGGVYYPDTLVGTDSHTTMINGIGIVGWGVGGIEAEAGMLGQPVYFLTPDVVGVHLTGALREGVTATDLALTVTQLLRKTKVVGKFVEFFGPGAAALPVVDRATIANMAPEYGATMGFFPIDAECVNYLRATGRSNGDCKLYENYYRPRVCGAFRRRARSNTRKSSNSTSRRSSPSVAGPKRPQDRIELPNLRREFFRAPCNAQPTENGFGKTRQDFSQVGEEPTTAKKKAKIGTGSVLIAGDHELHQHQQPERDARRRIAREEGRRKRPQGESRREGLARPGFARRHRLPQEDRPPAVSQQAALQLVGYGCTTCIGNSGPLDPNIEDAVVKNDLVAASVLSGNRNFEARVHQNIKANFLMSPPLVVAFALAGRVDIDLSCEPLGQGQGRHPVYLADIWPTLQEVRDAMQSALKPEVFRKLYKDFAAQNPKWNEIPSSTGNVYEWDASPPTSRSRRSSRTSAMHARQHRRSSGRARARHLRRQRHDRPHLARRRDQESFARRKIPARKTASSSPTSTATARAAATTAS